MAFLGQQVDCDTIDKAVAKGAEWRDFAVSFVAYPIHDRVYLYLWKAGDATCLAVEVPPTAVTHSSDGYERGQWLIQVLLAASRSFQVDVCGFGRLYGGKLFAALSVADVLSSLRDGTLFDAGYPSIHLVSVEMIGTAEMESLAEPYKSKPRFHYGPAADGFHVLSVI